MFSYSKIADVAVAVSGGKFFRSCRRGWRAATTVGSAITVRLLFSSFSFLFAPPWHGLAAPTVALLEKLLWLERGPRSAGLGTGSGSPKNPKLIFAHFKDN